MEKAPRLIGYARVSTTDQNTHLQTDALLAAGCCALYEDRITGVSQSRAGLDAALADVGTGDKLIVWRLDRLGRSIPHIMTIIGELAEKGASLVSLCESFDTGTEAGELYSTILAMIAHVERRMIVSRTRTITSDFLDWRGIVIQVTYERQRFVDHIQVETLEPTRGLLPITETGYRSHFIPQGVIDQSGGPEAYVEAWLDRAATGKGWVEQEASIRHTRCSETKRPPASLREGAPPPKWWIRTSSYRRHVRQRCPAALPAAPLDHGLLVDAEPLGELRDRSLRSL